MIKPAHGAVFPLAISMINSCPTAHAQRLVTPLVDNWRFVGADIQEAPSPQFDDTAWQHLNLPHTWNRVGYYFHNSAGTNTEKTVDKTQGPGWYRLRFNGPESPSFGKAWLEFDAASRVAKVWLNGILLGEHRGGFSRFRFDATAAMKPGVENVLVVRVDNTQPAAGSPTADVLPLAGDFFVHGGLYRPARLIITDGLHIDMTDHGGPGAYASTLAASPVEATLLFKAKVANDTSRSAKVSVRAKLMDRDGREVAASVTPLTLGAGSKGEAETRLTIKAPHLWQGTKDPYLHDLVVDVVDGKGIIRDRLTQKFGIRTITIDADKGFLLNGQPYRLRGVGYHQDRDGKGWAISRDDVAEDIATLQEMGANTIRLTHYQHGQDVHDLADQAGLVVWDEIPLVSSWTLGGHKDADPELVANAKSQLIELIRQNQNHAASAIWSIANEVDFGNSLPAFLTRGMSGKEINPTPLLVQLQAVAKTADPSRPTALATCCEGRLFAQNVSIPITAPAADLGGANRYFGWYYGEPFGLGANLDGLRALRPQQPLAITEYGAGGALTIHTDNVLSAPVDSRGRAQPEEYESYIHETALAQLDARPWLYATWLWNSFDFSSTVRAEGDAQDINTKGLVAYDHKTRKDAYYFYKANWNAAPMVHITSKRYTERAYPVTDVRVYSNTGSTELLLNGQSLGSKTDCVQKICVWKAVPLDEDVNSLIARGTYAGGHVQDEATWTLAAQTKRHMVIDAGTLVAGKGNGRLLGSDNWFGGGTAASLDTPANYGKPAIPAEISATQERDALATYRTGTFSYRVPVADGRYKVTLWFATSAGQKAGEFDVKSGKKVLLRKFQPAVPASGAVAEAKAFTINAKGTLTLDFISGTGDARVSMIEIERVR